MSKGDEEFDLTHAEDKKGRNTPKGSQKKEEAKGKMTRKRKRETENEPQDSSQAKRFKTSGSDNIKQEQDTGEVPEKELSQHHQNKFIEYNRMKNIYEEERMNQQMLIYLRRIAHDKTQQLPHLAQYPLLQYLCNACKMMLLNEYEIIAWALWLDVIPLQDDQYTVEEKVLFTAFFVKISLNENSELEEILIHS